jgi:hypothetical protein
MDLENQIIQKSYPITFKYKNNIKKLIHSQYKFWYTNSKHFVKQQINIHNIKQLSIKYHPWFVSSFYKWLNRIKRESEFIYKPLPPPILKTIIPDHISKE